MRNFLRSLRARSGPSAGPEALPDARNPLSSHSGGIDGAPAAPNCVSESNSLSFQLTSGADQTTIGKTIDNENILVENIEYSTIRMHIDQARSAEYSSKTPLRSSNPWQNSPSKPITEHLAYLLAQANREINRQLDARFRKEGVPVEQWRILKVLSDGKGHSMGELAEPYCSIIRP